MEVGAAVGARDDQHSTLLHIATFKGSVAY
jgi:hypothetical protein